MGHARGSSKVITIELTTSAGIYAAGDTIDSVKTVVNPVLDTKGTGLLHSLMLLDKVNQKSAIDLYFFDVAPTVGADNAAVNFSDADMANCLGRVSLVAGDYVTIDGGSGSAEATLRGIALLLQAAAGEDDIYLVAVSRGTPTYGSAAVNLVLRLGIIQD